MSNHSQRTWTYDEVFATLIRLVSCSKAKFFFLIDALDGSEPQDGLGELAGEILKISRLPNVKLCVSCRPWTSFVSNFSQAQTLYLDRLTQLDMRLYIQNRLAQVGAQNELCLEFKPSELTERAAVLVTKVADAAQDVFLWTELVVKALSSEMRKGCDFDRLTAVLADFPVGLDDYFHRLIFDRITRTKRNISDTAAALMLAMKISDHREHRLYRLILPHHDSFLNFWLLRSGRLEPGFSWTDHEDTWYTSEAVRRMVEQTNDYLEETCRGLLVLIDRRWQRHADSSEMGWNVEFFHRTVSDYLRSDRMKLVMKAESPYKFSGDQVLVELGKLRCTCLLREMHKDCRGSERNWVKILESSPVAPLDRAWLSDCEALTISRYRRSCECLGFEHNLLDAHHAFMCARTGSIQYTLTMTKALPKLAIGRDCISVLSGLLWGWWTHILEECNGDVVKLSGTSNLPSSWLHTWMRRDNLPDAQDIWLAINPKSLPFESRDWHCRWLNHLLWCGINANQEGHVGPLSKPEARPHPGSVWQNWLRFVYLNIKEVGNGPFVLGPFTGQFKKKISDIALILLQHGADPTCTVCTLDHSDEEACGLHMPLEGVLENIASYDVLGRAYPSQNLSSFSTHLANRDCMLKAIRSWIVSARCTPGIIAMPPYFVSNFLLGFVENTFARSCSSCSSSLQYSLGAELERTLVAGCLDCHNIYVLCKICSERLHCGHPDLHDLSKHIVHEMVRPDQYHETFCFAQRTHAGGFEGMEEAIAVLEEWYARQIKDEHSSVD